MEQLFAQKTDVRVEIREFLEERGTSKQWLANKIKRSNQYVNGILLLKQKLFPEILERINEALNTNFTLEQVPSVE